MHPAYAQAMNTVGTEPVESKGGVQLETQLENELGHVIRWIGKSAEVTQLVESEEVSLPLLGTYRRCNERLDAGVGAHVVAWRVFCAVSVP